MEEWHKETPIVVVFAKNVKRDGSRPNRWMPVVPWIAAKGLALGGVHKGQMAFFCDSFFVF